MTRPSAIGLALVLASGCGTAPPLVDLIATWPAQPGDFDDLTEAWTREGRFRRDYQEVFTVNATFKSPAWRAAHGARQARLRGLDQTATAALVAEHKAAGIAAYEFELIVTTWDRKENDLHRGAKATWKVILIDHLGRSIAPTKIVRDHRPRHVLRADFPEVGDFAEGYVAYFPVEPPVLGPGVKTMRMRFASERGATEVRWNGR